MQIYNVGTAYVTPAIKISQAGLFILNPPIITIILKIKFHKIQIVKSISLANILIIN
jgi:hypothetical protein